MNRKEIDRVLNKVSRGAGKAVGTYRTHDKRGGGRKTDLIDIMYVSGVGDYTERTRGITFIGDGSIAAYVKGDFSGKCVIYLHGNGECASDASFIERTISGDFYDTGVIAPDYPGYGMSSGKFSEQGCYDAAIAAYDYLVKDKKVDPKDIYILGYSLGSGPAAYLASVRANGGLILQAAYASGQDILDYFKSHYKDNKKIQDASPVTSIFPTKEVVADVKSKVLMIHGKNDTIVPFDQGMEIFANVRSEKTFVAVDNAGHNDFQTKMGCEFSIVSGYDSVAGYRKVLRDFIHGTEEG